MLDHLPIHIPIPWGSIFLALTVLSIVVVLSQIYTADCLDKVRRHATNRIVFKVRRGSMFFMLVSLCFSVAYGWKLGWDPWPPNVFFLAAFDVFAATHIFVMRYDLLRLRRVGNIMGRPVVD